MRAFDVAVVGTGPAGSSAALALAARGVKVLLVEKVSLPRYKTCGGGLIHRALRLLPASVEVSVESECHSAELNFLQQGLHFVTTRAAPIIYMTMRSNLDYQLTLEALRAGARLEEGCAVKSIRNLDECVELDTSKGRFRAKFVVAADGANGVVAKQSGWSELPNTIPALEYEVFVKEADFVRLSGTARFDFELIPNGYAWVFPKKEHLSVGVLSMARGRVNLPKFLQTYLELLGISRPEKVERHGYIIPVGPRRDRLARDRILLTGDTAGLVDPITAEGITHAIHSGQLAAQALADGELDRSRVTSRYESLLKDEVLPELRAGRILAWFLYQRPRLVAWLARQHGAALCELMTEVMMGRATYRGALGNMKNYLRLLGVHGLGKSTPPKK